MHLTSHLQYWREVALTVFIGGGIWESFKISMKTISINNVRHFDLLFIAFMVPMVLSKVVWKQDPAKLTHFLTLLTPEGHSDKTFYYNN